MCIRDSPDTVHWKGYPVPGGICEVSINPETGVLFEWKDGDGDSIKTNWFNMNEDFDKLLKESGAPVSYTHLALDVVDVQKYARKKAWN